MKMPISLDPYNTEFSPQKAYLLALASKLAYEGGSTVEKACKEFGFKKSRFILNKDTGTECFVASTDKFMVVCFRGTDELKDWFKNVNMLHTDGPLGSCHRGFAEAYRSIANDLDDAISDCRAQSREKLPRGYGKLKPYLNNIHPQSIWFTGHSLGGALATVAAGYNIESCKPMDGLYTYGSPRVFDWEAAIKFEQSAGKRTFRFVNNCDLVTRLPKRLMGYRHVGELKYFDENGVLKEDPSWWSRFVDRFQGRFEDVMEKGFAAVKDHDIDDYIKRAQRACENC